MAHWACKLRLSQVCLAADNTWSLESWCKKKFVGMEDSLGNFFKENGLTDDIDYII